jgi:NADH-quinone oxidoreductase subunit C
MAMSEALTTLGEKIVAGLGGAATGHSIAFDQLTVTVQADKIVDVVKFLRDDPGCRFVSIIDVTAVDYPGREKRFDVFPGADWFERECYDLYGVIFTGHPDMRRLLTDYGFDGHPLRKDFPLTGFVEVRYDDQEKRVVYEPVRLNQEFRKFDFLSPWEGADYPVLPGDEKAGVKP